MPIADSSSSHSGHDDESTANSYIASGEASAGDVTFEDHRDTASEDEERSMTFDDTCTSSIECYL